MAGAFLFFGLSVGKTRACADRAESGGPFAYPRVTQARHIGLDGLYRCPVSEILRLHAGCSLVVRLADLVVDATAGLRLTCIQEERPLRSFEDCKLHPSVLLASLDCFITGNRLSAAISGRGNAQGVYALHRQILFHRLGTIL